jgi:hypothetical protein
MAHPALEYINTAATVAGFLISQDLKVTIENVRDFFRRNPSNLSTQFERPQELAFLQRLVIDPELLEELTGEVPGAIGAEIKCLKAARTHQAKDACGRRAEKSVCDALNRIQDRNHDDLPTEYLKDRWNSYRCVRF